LSKTGADVLIVESGGADTSPTIGNPSVWFYNIGGPLDWKLPIAPVPQLNNRKFNMALGHVLGGGSSINAMVWTRGMERDYDAWERNGATGWGFKEVLAPTKPRRIGKEVQTIGAVSAVLSAFASQVILTPQRRLFWRPRSRWACPLSMM
jgi:GMC oxidoreductase